MRCDRLLVSDVCGRAVELARMRLAESLHVQVAQAQLPRDWPEGSFDLIVISELGYFLTPQDLDALADNTLATLRPGGTVLACHWRRPIEGCSLAGEEVHLRLEQRLGLERLTELREADCILTVWSSDGRSVAEREGFDW